MSRRSRALPVVAYDCMACPAHCCTSVAGPALVTDVDMQRLERFTGRHPSAFCFPLANPVGDLIARLIHVDGRCTLLDPATRRCTVYAARPGVCRRYPGSPRCALYDTLVLDTRPKVE